MSEFVYFSSEWAILEHDNVLRLTGGKVGVTHPQLIESALGHIQNDDYYPEAQDKLGHLVYSIAKNHCFVDGNKRSSIAIGSYFLSVNGFENLVPKFIVEMENIVLLVVEDLVSKDNLTHILGDLLLRGEIGENNKLLLVAALESFASLQKGREDHERLEDPRAF